MRPTTQALLCELHAHSTWSDGELSLTELVDLYGRSGFDVLCVTDHVGIAYSAFARHAPTRARTG